VCVAGQERFAGLSRIFYTHAVAAIIVYDITARDTFDSVLKWKQDIDAKVFLPSGARIPVLLLGNKSDLLDEGMQPCIPPEDLDSFLSTNQFYAHFLCSAKTGVNVKEACTHLVAKIHANNQSEMITAENENANAAAQNHEQTVTLAGTEARQEPKAGCCN